MKESRTEKQMKDDLLNNEISYVVSKLKNSVKVDPDELEQILLELEDDVYGHLMDQYLKKPKKSLLAPNAERLAKEVEFRQLAREIVSSAKSDLKENV